MVTVQAVPPRSVPALLAAVPAAVGVLVALVAAIVQYAGIDGLTTKHLFGLDSFLGLPFVAISVIFFSIFVAWFVGAAAGAAYRHGPYVVAIVVASLGTVYQLLAVILNPSGVSIVLIVCAAGVLVMALSGCRAARAAGQGPQIDVADRQKVFGVLLVVAGIAGLTAAYNLSVDKVTVILFPAVNLNCNVSILVACGKNLGSWQGSLFGFPNPLIGLGGYSIVLVTGLALLTGVRYPRWWWLAFNAGVLFAFAFITFLIISSVYFIGTLCLWCALVWIVTIPTFWTTTIGNLRNGNLKVGPRATRFFTGAYSWVPLVTLVCYLAIFLIYEVDQNLLARL